VTPALRETLATALGLPLAEVDALELLVRVSAIGRSHAEPGLRLFAYRDGVALASIKRLARPPAAVRDRLIGCYSRFAGHAVFAVPSLLAWCEDADHLHLIESMVPGEPLAALLGRGAVQPAEAAARLEAVLAALWERGEPSSEEEIERESATLRDAATAMFGDQLAVDLVGAALGELRRHHRSLLRRVLTTRDVHLGNLHVDPQGRTWLTDFDLTAETVFFGLDVVRAWIHSAPLAAGAPPPFLPADAYRLFETIYPVHEYALQAPLLAEPEREELRTYAQDLFVRLALPRYHRQAVARPDPTVAHPPQAQVFFADATSGFSESESLRFPFDLDSGQATLSAVIRTDRPLHALRLDPINLPHTVVSVVRWTVARQGHPTGPLDAAPLCGGDGAAAGAALANLIALPGAPATFFATTDDPQIILPADALAAVAGGGNGDGDAYALDVELTLRRDWTLAPALAPALLLGRMQSRIDELAAARVHELAHAQALAADARRQARLGRHLALRLSAQAEPPAMPVAGGLPARLARLAGAARGRALTAAGAVLRRLRAHPAAAPASADAGGLALVASGGRVWDPPHVAVLVDLDATPPAVADVQAWAAAQTCASIEVVVWSRARGLAWDAHHPHAAWSAADWPALRATLAGRHVAIASADLLAQPPIHLERALLALEPEDLCFAVAAGAARAAAVTALRTGRGPGDAAAPLARTVARAEVVADDWTLDLDACRAERGAAGGALGKLLGDSGAAAPPPFARPLRGAAPGVLDHYVVADPGAGRVVHPIAPADRVLPLPPLPSPLPTVLMVFPFLAVGGAERVHLDVVRGLRDRVRFVVVSIEPHDDALGTMVEAFRAETPYVYTAPDSLNPLLTTSLFEHLIRRFAPRTLYIANGSGWIYDALPTLKALYPRLRTVNQVYDFAAGWIERLDPPLMAVLDAHISCNRRISAALVERGAAPAAAVTIHNAPDLTLFDPAAVDAERRAALAAAFGLPPGRRVVAFVGRMHQQKRPMDVVELARQLRGDASLAFLLVGDGPLGTTVREQVAACGLEAVSVQPFHQPSRECYALADVLILPSEYEGMPMVILEALAMGVPVVATDVGNNREVLERTGGGRIVERVGDVAALRAAVLDVLAAPPDPAALRAAVAREFGMPEKLDAYARVLLG